MSSKTVLARPLLITKKRAAFLLGVSEATIDYLIRSRRLLCRRIGKRLMVDHEAVRGMAGKI